MRGIPWSFKINIIPPPRYTHQVISKNISVIKENINQYQTREDVNISNQGGYQTAKFSWEVFHPDGREYIENVVNNIFSLQKPVSIAGWWYNINPQGAWNTPHSHGGADYALVWYLTDSNGLLKLMNPLSNRIDNILDKSFNTKKGDILIFPGDIIHYVMPNTKETDRVCISMNLQLCGK